MKATILTAVLFFGFQALAAGPNGNYYQPLMENGDTHNPEQLQVITDTQIITYTVHYGAKTTETRAIKVKGRNIMFAAHKTPEQNFDCNGHKVSYSAGSAPAVTLAFEKRADSLVLTYQGQKLVMMNATPEQSTRIRALPECKQE